MVLIFLDELLLSNVCFRIWEFVFSAIIQKKWDFIKFRYYQTRTTNGNIRLLALPIKYSPAQRWNKVWNKFKVNNRDTRITWMTSFWCLYCYLWTYLTPVFSVSIVDVELNGLCSNSVCKREYNGQIKSVCFATKRAHPVLMLLKIQQYI